MKQPQGFQKPLVDPEAAKPVRVAIITTTGEFASCSCGGWATNHPRDKVRGDRAQRHLDRHHDGAGVWL